MIKFKHAVFLSIAITFVCFAIGCSKQSQQKEKHLTLVNFIESLTDLRSLPILNDANIKLYSSHDRTGGNSDYNNFAGPSKEAGWVILADLKGPGCIRRWWMTGMDPGHRVRLYIDGEKTPRIDEEIQSLFGSKSPWTPPLAQYVNMCYYSYVPIPFNKSLRVEMMQPNTHPLWGPRRLFYQIGVEQFDGESTSVESYPKVLTQSHLNALKNIRDAWTKTINSHDVPIGDDAIVTTIKAGQKADIFGQDEAGTIQSWNIHVKPASGMVVSQRDREYLLQDAVVRIYYDGSTFASIETPLGDFFANAWRKRSYGSAWFTSGENGYSCRLPMPFRKGIRVEVENGSDVDIDVAFSADVVDTVSEDAGYLHAEYRRSGPSGAQPHVVTKINGRGKFIGTFLGVTGLDDSWWILEGDESMWVDGNPQPVWQGTGLEDYFNGGWYYRGSVFGAFSGDFDRSPFRVAQFRHQHPDPVSFQHFFQMQFERMRNEQNGQPVNGYFQSVAYSYLEKPTAVQSVPARKTRRAVDNPNEQTLFMLQLVELERMNDFYSAARYIDEYIERWPEAEDVGVYRLRQLEYRKFLGENITDADYAPFLSGEYGEEAAKQAKILEWFYSDSKRALIGMNANGKAKLLLDGKPLMAGDHPFYLYVMGAELDNGPHKLAAEVEFQRSDPWIQLGVRIGHNLAGMGPGTLNKRSVESDWATREINTANWYPIELRNVPRGVPDAPYLGGIANAFILLQSKSYPIAGQDWGYYRGKTYFRQDFTVPILGWPDFSINMTGLTK